MEGSKPKVAASSENIFYPYYRPLPRSSAIGDQDTAKMIKTGSVSLLRMLVIIRTVPVEGTRYLQHSNKYNGMDISEPHFLP